MDTAHAYAAAYDISSFEVSQLFWSLAIANPGAFASDHALMDNNALAFYAEIGMGVMAFTARARGFFSKSAANGIDSLKPERRHEFENGKNLARLARAQQLAQKLGVSVTAVNLAYITAYPFVAVPIIGPSSLAQLHDSLAGADLTLTPEMMRYLGSGEENEKGN